MARKRTVGADVAGFLGERPHFVSAHRDVCVPIDLVLVVATSAKEIGVSLDLNDERDEKTSDEETLGTEHDENCQ